jgi:hypothetical protein
VRRSGLAAVALSALLVRSLAAEEPTTPAAMYHAWCASCHGEDGRGRPPAPTVATRPLDFTRCARTTGESDADWTRVIIHGGPAAGRSSEMPGFEQLSETAVHALLSYIRRFCTDSGWPSGNLNFPHAVFTPKAFPDAEVLIQPMVSHTVDENLRMRLDMRAAMRVARRGEVEVTLPAETVTFVGHRRTGVGDVSVEGQYVVYDSAARGAIASVGLETSFETGSLRWGFGEGTTEFEPFLSAGVTTGPLVAQFNIRGLLPTHRIPGEPVYHVEYRAAVHRVGPNGPAGWTPGFEIGAIDTSLALTPEVLKGLTKTGSLTAGFGVEIPIRPVPPKTQGVTRWSGFVLWDYREPFRARP